MGKTVQELLDKEYKSMLGHKRFKNNQSPRLSGQGFTASITKPDLSFQEFLDSYIGAVRLKETAADFSNQEDFDFEIEHLGNVLYDNVIS